MQLVIQSVALDFHLNLISDRFFPLLKQLWLLNLQHVLYMYCKSTLINKFNFMPIFSV